MVTAGIFMVARMSPLFELSETALSFVMVIGAITALFMALIAIVQNDIKRVVAYSTLSQLGYMTVALGASAYSAAIFHLMTHAFFKAVLFLGAGSVIIALHHEQDMRKMGGLRKYMPITWITADRRARANAGIPPFAGFFSKDAIIEAVHALEDRRATASPTSRCWPACSSPPSTRSAWCSSPSTARSASIRPGRRRPRRARGRAARRRARGRRRAGRPRPPRRAAEGEPWVVTVPLVLLAIPSVFAGWTTSSRCSSATTSAPRSSCGPSTRCSGNSRTSSTASPHSSCTACCRCRSGWRGGRHRRGVVLLHRQPGAAGADQAAIGPLYTLLEQQVRLRPLQRLVLRRRRAPARRRPVEGRRRDDDRRLLRQRLGAAGRLGRLAAAPRSSRATSTTTRSP